ncbi:MAG: PTS sugar transporter subunit IIA [bacterium]
MVNERILTTKELAKYIKLNEKTVIKMAQTGKLPGTKIGTQWRFYLTAIDNYLRENMGRVTMIKPSDNTLDDLIRTADEIIPLSRLIIPAFLKEDLQIENKESALLHIADMAVKLGLTPSSERLFEELEKREEMLSTALGDGMAIPHPRYPSEELFKAPHIILIVSKKGINFDAPDKKKVYLFFVICAPDLSIHLGLLAKTSQLLHIKGITQKFIQADTSEQILRALLEVERQLIYS